MEQTSFLTSKCDSKCRLLHALHKLRKKRARKTSVVQSDSTVTLHTITSLISLVANYIILSINPSCAFSQDKAIRSMETCISDVKQWMTSDKLILNDDKTEFIVIASQHLLKKAAVKIIIIIIKYLYSAYTFQC